MASAGRPLIVALSLWLCLGAAQAAELPLEWEAKIPLGDIKDGSTGARTAFFSPEMDRYFLAVRATDQEPAAVWIYRPTP